MPKNKRPVPRRDTPEDKDDALTRLLCALALDLAEREDSDTMSAVLREQAAEFDKLVRKCLVQKKDEVLYEAIERARYEDIDACQYLRRHLEEASSTVLVRREGAPEMEINAFVIPLFVHSTGGLREEQTFQDQDAFEQLVQSFQQAQLESAKAKVVLMSHAYDLAEIDAITYSHLNAMVRDALASMTDKKMPATPALERSITGWAPSAFGAADSAVELRFLLGFALKRADDPFYRVPDEEEAADAYFAARMGRYEQWTQQAAALVARLLAPAGSALTLNFLYQDLFHGAKEQGMAEYFILQMMTELNLALQEHKVDPQQAAVIVAPCDVAGEMLLRVNLYGAAGGPLLASSDKPLALGADLEIEVDDIADALGTIGVRDLSVALKFDHHGAAVEVRPYPPR